MASMRRFYLNRMAVDRLIKERTVNLKEARETLVRELKAAGYTVFASEASYYQLPSGLFVMGNSGSDTEKDFHAIAGRLGIRYMSGDPYNRAG